jgi:predicted ATPase
MTSEQYRPAHVPNDGTLIRTPDERLRVFVSSTLAELAPERAAVGRAISALRLTPVMFELGARPHPPQELYRAYLAKSDIFIGLYWQRYGWVGPGMSISGLEDEFRRSGSLPRLLYLKRPAPDQEPALTALLAEIQADGTDAYRTFTSPRELGRLVRDDLAVLLSERFAVSARPRPVSSSPDPVIATTLRRTVPATSTSLIGRADDIVAVTNLLESADTRLVTLTGPGGIGKTRLAIAVSEMFEARSTLRPLFVPLAAIAHAELVWPHVAAVAGLPIEGNRPALDALIEHFSSAPALLILDNLEQVAGVAPECDQLLSFCPDLKILATSRRALRLRAEREYVVAALAVPRTGEPASVEQLTSAPAVQLFLDRARAVRHGFSLTEANAPAVVEICRRLDGLPLAIELAAARTRLLEPVGLLARLERVLDIGAGPVDLPERQRTLRATVEWSMDLLDEPQQELLATLSIFADGWTVGAAASVSEQTEDEALDRLDGLAGHSLVSVDAAEAAPRFRMLSAVRELAAERLADAVNHARVEERHAAYFAALVDSGDGQEQRQTDWADRLRTEEQNLRVAIRWFFTHDISPLPHLFRALWLYWQMSDRMPEGRAFIDELRRRGDPPDDRARAEVLFTWAVTACAVGDDESALTAADGIARLQGTVDDPSLASALQLAMAWTLPIRDDVEGALVAASTALQGFRQRNEPFVALAALTVGLLEMSLRRDAAATAYFVEVKELGDRFGNIWLSSTAGTQLASLAVRAGRIEPARALLVEAVDSIDGTNVSTLTATFALVAFAHLALAEGDPRQAAVALGAVEGLRRREVLLAWPATRRGEADLAAELELRAEPGVVAERRALGSALHKRDALALVRAGLLDQR